ncbi:hypothetical protein G210_2985 [Candida maltosa Xu316]|uniref:Uncharacterized protein n=1 Tax=Candida maltosa (strain Xu316) TaxID=1245528 RepID=M3J462_CANMX|nr:hypothetical protein G210_2985 [Candida maltosa Xu316]
MLNKISIRSQNLKCLRLKGTNFNTITPQNFQIPESLVELSVVAHGKNLLYKSFIFPQNLQILNFHHKLRRIPKVPSKLKNLHIVYDPLKATQSDFAGLPTSLEVLTLKVSTNVKRYMLIPDVSHLVNLKKLYFSSVEFKDCNVESINLDNFPKLLTDLYVNGCRVQKVIGNFTDFPNLKALSLDNNNLNDWLSPLPNEFSFSDTIESISLRGNKLDNDTVRTLVSYLKDTYPNFRQLFVDTTNLSRDMHYLVMERYLVSYRTMHPVLDEPIF